MLNNEGVMAPPPPSAAVTSDSRRGLPRTRTVPGLLSNPSRHRGNLPVNAELGPEAGQCEDTELDPNGIQNGTSCNLKSMDLKPPPMGIPWAHCAMRRENYPSPAAPVTTVFAGAEALVIQWDCSNPLVDSCESQHARCAMDSDGDDDVYSCSTPLAGDTMDTITICACPTVTLEVGRH